MTFLGTSDEKDAEKRGTRRRLLYTEPTQARSARRPPLRNRAGSKTNPNLRTLAGTGSTANRWAAKPLLNERVSMDAKTILYRGGIVKFRIPKHWIEEYELNGGGTFYEKGDDTGTLRLNILTVEPPPNTSGNLALQAINIIKGIEISSIEELPNGRYLGKEKMRSIENGQSIILYWWYISKTNGEKQVNIAMFSYTIISGQENNQKIINEIGFIDQSIRNIEFSSKL